MIGRLTGQLIIKQPPQLMIDVNGVGYELEAPMSTFYQLPELNQTLSLYTHLVVREDAHLLYGFATEAERRLFRSLLKVNGVGAKLALAILSGMSAVDFAHCVHAEDTAQLVRLPGVGKKTAERLIIEMRDRLDEWQETVGAETPTLRRVEANRPADAAQEALHALIALGYKPQEASRMLSALQEEFTTSEEMIRAALKSAVTA